ncbi:MAG: NADH-quinone oxidoreductase subunit A [Candidatus Wallbacteria bacterium]|nr:NADH-quinone oxidoreductase subunit A [Candidatus Wallbacteria bacterium]
MHFDYLSVLVLVALGIGNVLFMVALPKLLRPSKPNPQKLVAYECGENPVGTSWIQYNARFFSVALVFVVFDVEIVFMFPWAVVFKSLYKTQGCVPFWEMFTFVLVLLVGLAYLWAQGLLEWVKSVRKA